MEVSFLTNRHLASIQTQGLRDRQLKSNYEMVNDGFLHQVHPDILSLSPKNTAVRFSARTDLHAAAEACDYDKVRSLINKYKGPGLYAFLAAKDSDTGKTALHIVAGKKGATSASIATLLLNPYEDSRRIQDMPSAKQLANERDLTNRIPLHDAVLSGQIDLSHFLIIAGSNLDAQDNGGQTPVHCAANKGYSTILQDLLTHGATKDIRDFAGLTPLDLVKNSPMRQNEASILRNF
jgi:ankyrin repeat protein